MSKNRRKRQQPAPDPTLGDVWQRYQAELASGNLKTRVRALWVVISHPAMIKWTFSFGLAMMAMTFIAWSQWLR